MAECEGQGIHVCSLKSGTEFSNFHHGRIRGIEKFGTSKVSEFRWRQKPTWMWLSCLSQWGSRGWWDQLYFLICPQCLSQPHWNVGPENYCEGLFGHCRTLCIIPGLDTLHDQEHHPPSCENQTSPQPLSGPRGPPPVYSYVRVSRPPFHIIKMEKWGSREHWLLHCHT